MRFPGFEGEWEEIKLNKFLKFKNGYNAPKEDYGSGIKFINVSDILENDYLVNINIKDSVEISEKKLNENQVKYGDILFQRSSETREEVGTANVYLDETPCTFGGFVIRGKKINDYEPYFMKNLLNSQLVRKEITSWSGGSTRYNIGQDSLNKITVLIPSIKEQEKISKLFMLLNKKIKLMEKKYSILEKYHNSLIHQMYTFKHNKPNITFENRNWEEISLKNILEEINIKSTTNNQYPLLSSTVNGIFLQKEYFDRNVGSKDNTGYKIISKNEIVFSPQNLWMGNINVNDKFEKGIVSPSYKIFKTNQKVRIGFLKYLLKTERMIFEYKLSSEQGASVVRRNLNMNLFLDIKIKIPSIEEQEKIASIMDNITSIMNKIKKEINISKEFKRTILSKMFC